AAMARWNVLVPALLAAAAGCQDKTNAQKMAEQAASAKASAQASASASAAVKDPNEEKFAKARKDVKERATAHMTALQKLYTGVPESEMMEEIREIESVLGTALTAWRGIVVSANRS
ncbi:MAG: hypothetical protein HUU21_38005, partial [Polyangiaceae bacterium]|nr:hypothetical protein [Polyangiaceae bacterium]